jgi:malonyl CoA-acyl carrier protein transacylase
VLALRAAGAESFTETGPGEVLTKTVKRILRGAPAHA